MQGTHLIADCHSCSGNLINLDKLREVCTKAIVDNDLSIVTEAWHKFPGDESGITGTLVLAESHLAIHTWPEIGKTTLDIYVCNYSKDNTDSASRALETIISYLNPDSSDRHIINRGK